MKHWQRILGAIILAAALFLQQAAHQRPVHPVVQEVAVADALTTPLPSGFVLITKVVDGDTVELADGTKIRYLGMDTPETVHPKKPVQCFGHEASDYNRSLVEGKAVRLVKDISNTDMYGRLLRYLYLADGTFVNLTLVQQGYAYASVFPPDIAHAKEFAAAMAQARETHTGLWGSCPIPAKYQQ